MYTLVDTIGLKRSIGAQWESVDHTDLNVFQLYNMYIKLYLELLDDVTGNTLYVDMDTLNLEFSSYMSSLEDMLLVIGNRPIDTVPSIPDTTIKHVRYSDAIRSEYKLELTDRTMVVPPNYPRDDLHDVKVTRPGYETDLALLHSHCLVSVNGFYHMTDTDGSVAFIVNGAKTLRASNDNNVGITSFLDVGALTKIPLDPANIVDDGLGGTLKDKVYFSVPDNLEGKSYILILGGYMIMPSSGIFWRNGQQTFAVDLNKIPYVERLFESQTMMDLTDLNLTTIDINPSAVNLAEVWSDDTIRNYFTLSQSYLVLVDTPNLISNKYHLRRSNLPGMFTAYQDPTMPLVSTYGKLVEYWKVHEDGFWSVTVTDSFLRNYLFKYQVNPDDAIIANTLLAMNPYDHSRAFLLDIQTF